MIWALLAGIITILIVLNETSLFHRENPEFTIPENRTFLCDEAAPFHIKTGSEKAVLFVHGFPSTPAVYRWAAGELSKEGWDCAAPLLPGFGTDWHDLISTNYSQWYSYLSEYYRDLRKLYKKLFIVGTSMGGALTLKLAEDFSSDPELAPDGIVTIAAPVFINKIFFKGILKNPGYYFVRTIGWFVKSWKAENVKTESPNNVDGRGRWRGYDGIFPVQTYSLKIGLKKIGRDLERVTVPHLIFHDRGDRTVPFENSLYIAGKVKSPSVELRITRIGPVNHEHHNLLIYDSTRKDVLEGIKNFLGKNG